MGIPLVARKLKGDDDVDDDHAGPPANAGLVYVYGGVIPLITII